MDRKATNDLVLGKRPLELKDRYTDLCFCLIGSAFLTDAIIVQGYIEIRSSLERVLAVVKVRGSAHSKELRQFEITGEGITIGKPIEGYEGILGAHPTQAPLAPNLTNN